MFIEVFSSFWDSTELLNSKKVTSTPYVNSSSSHRLDTPPKYFQLRLNHKKMQRDGRDNQIHVTMKHEYSNDAQNY